MSAPRVIRLFVSILTPFLVLLLGSRVTADMAPLPQAAVSDLMPAHGTRVQMLTEKVVMDLRLLSTMVPVTAEFTMYNSGDSVEDMEVRFPLAYPTPHEGSADRYGNQIKDLRAFVEGAEVPTRTAQFDETPWAVWSVSFPPGKDVHVSVTCSTRPVDWGTYADLYYILETGAGWRGPIGQGDIIFRFPYLPDPEMFVTSEVSYTPYFPSSVPNFIIEGSQLRWHFEDLEPSPKDNVNLRVLYPRVWRAILMARLGVERYPTDARAYTALGEAYEAAIPIKHGWPGDESGLAMHFGPLAEAAYRRGADLAPNSVDAHLALAGFLTEHAWNIPPEPWYSDARHEVSRVRQLHPGDQRALELAGYLDAITHMGILTPQPSSTPRPTATATATRLPTRTATPTVPTSTSSPTAMPAPTLTALPKAQALLVPSAVPPTTVAAANAGSDASRQARAITPVASATTPAQTRSLMLCGAAVVVVAATLVAGIRRRPRGRA